MQSTKAPELTNNPSHKGFVTIDDMAQKAEDLASGLRELSNYKYPLDIRRGTGDRKGVKKMERDKNSHEIKAGKRTYFFDIKKTKEGKPFLVITESRFKGEDGQRQRNSILV